MPNVIISPLMSMPVPVVGVDIGPDWAQNVNACFSIVDGHNHVPGSGTQVPSAGININSDLPFNNNNATILRSARFFVNLTPLSLAADLDCIYVSGVDLYYNDSNGNKIQLTKAGAPNAGTGNISNLPSSPIGGAGIAWVNATQTFEFDKDDGGPGANIDVGTIILRYPGSYPTPVGNAINIQAPTSLSTAYAITLPANVPVSSGAMLTEDTGGQISYTFADNVTLQNIGGSLSIKGSITGAMISPSTIDGTNIANNINLPGSSVKANSLNVVVSRTNATDNLAIIRGICNSSGTKIGGEGFTSSSLGAGQYQINFTTGFIDVPTTVVTPRGGVGFYATYIPNGNGSVFINTFNAAGTQTSIEFNFVVIGQT